MKLSPGLPVKALQTIGKIIAENMESLTWEILNGTVRELILSHGISCL